MKIQAKSIGIKSPLRTLRAQANEVPSTQGTLLTTGPLGGNLQALAAELNQSATQGLFEYPRNWVLMAKVAAIMLIALAAASVVRTVQPIFIASQNNLPISAAGVSIWQLIATGVGALLAITAAAVLTNLFPSLRVTPQGLGISELLGWRRVRWDQVGVLRVMELENDRYVVMVPFKGITKPPTPAPVSRLIPLLAGAGRGERGLVITSEIQNFDRMLQLMVSYIAENAGQNLPRLELFVDETAVMPFAQMVLQPEAAIVRMARRKVTLDAFGLAADDIEPELEWNKVIPRQVAMSLPAALLFLIGAMFNAAQGVTPLHFLGVVAFLALGTAELPFMAKLIQTVGDIMVGSGQFARSGLAYLELQMPRVVMIAVGLVLVSLGLPLAAAEVCWLAGLGLTTWFTIRFVQRVYYISAAQTILAAVGSLIFQVAMLVLFISIS
jgi:hypothetical protein